MGTVHAHYGDGQCTMAGALCPSRRPGNTVAGTVRTLGTVILLLSLRDSLLLLRGLVHRTGHLGKALVPG
jgi:hypothetical protein